MTMPGQIYSDVPWLTPADIQVLRVPTWSALDEVASAWLGRPCLALPSVRVGLCWALEQQGYARHRDHMLVPRFIGRCILNSVGRFALPVESPTAQTRIALVVDQFGRRQDIAALKSSFSSRGWSYIEDSPYGIGFNEQSGEGSLGRFIGLGKVLPVVQGGLFVPGDEAISRAIKLNRERSSGWALPVWLTMFLLRKRFAAGYSDVADAAYEMYPAARGGCGALRANLAAVFRRIDGFERESKVRLDAAMAALGAHVLMPDQRRLGYQLPFLPGEAVIPAQAIFRESGFSDAVLHIDLSRNMLMPNHVKCLLVPLNPRIPRGKFAKLLSGLKKLIGDFQLSIG